MLNKISNTIASASAEAHKRLCRFGWTRLETGPESPDLEVELRQ